MTCLALVVLATVLALAFGEPLQLLSGIAVKLLTWMLLGAGRRAVAKAPRASAPERVRRAEPMLAESVRMKAGHDGAPDAMGRAHRPAASPLA